VSPARATISP